MISTKGIPVVAYYRMSTDKQDTSIDQQRREVEQLAQNRGLNIIRDYIDEGISGDATEKRMSFLRMRDDAQSKGDFEHVVCWDQDRVGRFDMMDAGYWLKPLRDVGVSLITVAQGDIDWNSFAGRITSMVQQENKHQFLRDLSRNVARGLKQNVENGFRSGGTPPYGYDRIYLKPDGTIAIHVPYGEIVSLVSREWKSKLSLSEDQTAVDTVKWLYRNYHDREIGLQRLCGELNDKGIPSPSGRLWCYNTIYAILQNQTYCGDLIIGRRRSGKYHCVESESIRPLRREELLKGDRIRKPRELWVVTPNAHPAIVDRHVFDAVQQKLRRRRGRGKPKNTKIPYLFAGILFCGKCGKRMVGGQNGGKSYTRRYYKCPTYHAYGNRKGCCGWSIREEYLSEFMRHTLTSIIFAATDGRELYQLIRDRLREQQSSSPDDRNKLKSTVAKQKKKIERLAKKLDDSGYDLWDELAPQMASLKREKLANEKLLGKLENKRPKQSLDQQARAVVAKLESLHEELKMADPDRLCHLWKCLVDRIDVWFEKARQGRCKTFYRLTRGEIQLGAAFASDDDSEFYQNLPESCALTDSVRG